MDELDPKLRSLLNAARDADDPDERDALRVRAAIAATLAQPPASAGEQPPPPATASGAPALWKWLGIGVVATGLIASGVALQSAGPERAQPQRVPPPAVAAPQPEPPSVAPAPVAIQEPAQPEPAQPEPAKAPPDAHKPHRSTTARVAPEPEPALAPKGPSELALIRSATGALRDGDGPAAMRVLEQHAELYPEGVLKQERQGLRVLALCALGRTSEALRERAQFLSVAPHSPLAGRVQAACSQSTEQAP